MISATLLLLGIYEDTGSLTYANTTPRDARACAWLLECGANLSVVADFLNHPLSQEQRQLYDALFESAETIHFHGLHVVIAMAHAPGFMDEISTLAHKLRDINYAIECDDTKLMKDMKQLLKEAMLDHKEEMTIEQRVILKQQYEESFAYLLDRPVIKKSETHKQIKSLTKARDKIFTFLLHPNIPPDNNGSERAIRNIKVKLKVSGQFKTFQGAQDYASLRSIVDTSRKRGLNEFDSLMGVIRGDSVF